MSGEEVLDEIFVDGPDGFLDKGDGPSRLRRFVCAVTEGLPLEMPPPVASHETPPAPEKSDAEELQGADAWKNDAMRKWRNLWSGDTDTLKDVFNEEAPAQFVAFEEAIRGANTWSTFMEFRLDAALMGLPPEDENLFEKCVLNDQLNYLGTALPEVFSGVVSIGTLGNGDSYHLELSPPEGQDEPMVFIFDHETHRFEWAFSVNLESLVYLAALCRAVADERVSGAVAKKGYASLHNRVAPSWHFGMDERDEDFVPFEKKPNECAPLFLFWRSLWLTYLFRHNGHVDIDDVFAENLNVVLPAEHVPARMEVAKRAVPTALYATWRAYLFDEEELDQYMEISRAHPARLVRDAAKLIDELRGGRKVLGRIEDWPAYLAKFRALDLDPRRAAEREAEAEAEAERVAAERVNLRRELADLEGEAEEAYVSQRLDQSGLFGTMLHVLLAKESRAKAKDGVDFLLEQGYSRENSLYRHEQHDACRHIAANADPALLALLLGALVHGPGGNEEEVMLSGNDLFVTLMAAPELIPEAAKKALVGALENLDLENTSWREHCLVRLAGGIREGRCVAPLRAILAKIPTEGGFETALKFDTLLGYIGEALRLIGDASAAPELTPFAESSSLRLRKARCQCALAIAAIAPDAFTDVMAERAVEFMTQINSGEENAMALFAVAKGRPKFQPAMTTEPMASKKPNVLLAKALVAQDEEAIFSALKAVFSTPAYDTKGTISRCQLGVLACQLFGLSPAPGSLQAASGLSVELDEALAAFGEFESPRRLTWFDVAEMDSASLSDALKDPSIIGRSYAARKVRGDESARSALETAVRSVDGTGKLVEDKRYLLKEALGSLMVLPEVESTVSLCAELLLQDNRDIKDPVLRHLPPWPGLKAGMEFVRDAKWGWQEGAANKWLEKHA